MGRITTQRALGAVALVLAAALGTGCERARVRNLEADRLATLPRPGRVVVFDFDTGRSDIRLGGTPRRRVRRGFGLTAGEADLLAEAMADALATRTVAEVQALGLRAERAAGAALPAPYDLVIQGQFVRIDEGSMAKRFVIGLGVGATELRTQVEMFQVTSDGWRPIKQFDTVAQGKALPGAAFFVAGGAATGAVGTAAIATSGLGVLRELRSSLQGDAGRTASQIAAQVGEIKTSQRW